MLLKIRIRLVLLFAFLTPLFAAAEDTVVWRVGLRDDSSSESTGQAFPAVYAIPTDWAQRSQWPEFAPQVTGQPDLHTASDKLDTSFQYSFPAVPAHGALFRFKTLNASSFVTEVAVFANGLPCGILQMVGTEGWLGEDQKGRRFGNTHAVYIPPEFFRTGNNTLRIEKLGHPYCRENTNYSSVTLDWLELGPGEAIQYILEKDERLTQLAACPAAPTNLRAAGGKIGKLGYAKLAWDGGPAEEIKIQRSADGKRFFQVDAIPAAQSAYEDASRTGPEPGRVYWYRVKAATARGESAVSNVVRVEIPQ